MAGPLGEGWRARDPRLPICVDVITRPPLSDCWSLNLSASGMALVATPEPARGPPLRGSSLEVAFALPDDRTRVRAVAEVRWVHAGAGQLGGQERIALGISFQEMAPADRAALALYLSAYRPHVVLALGTEEEARGHAEAIGSEMEVHRATSAAELRDLLERGDIAAVVLLGDDGRAAGEALEVLAAGEQAPLGDPSPRVICAAAIASDRLVSLYDERRIHHSLPRPTDPSALWVAVQRACQEFSVQADIQRAMLELERVAQRKEAAQGASSRAPPAGGAIAESAEMRAVFDLARIAAPHDVPVLLLGETGTGKEVLARTLHAWSSRAGAPFVAVDAGALTETLLESELFGHMKGSFTGAVHDHPGLLQVANGGTVFLDEIQNMTPALQAKLLRAIETGEVRPVGGTRTRRVDIRIVAASNADLRKEVDAGRFRADLFYRLHRFPIEIPPLRRRRTDIPPLAGEFLRQAGPTTAGHERRWEAGAIDALCAHDWPGNVRELKSVIERAVLLSADKETIGKAALPPELVDRPLAGAGGRGSTLKELLADYERELVRKALQTHGGVVRRAAHDLGMDPATFARRVRRYGLGPASR